MHSTVLAALVVMLALSGASATSRDLKTIVFEASGKCEANAQLSVQGWQKSACVKAFAAAAVVGCTAHGPIDRFYISIFNAVYDFAKVYVQIAADAAAQCETHGNAIGCAAADAWAHKTEQAYVHVFAEAFASASNQCDKCDPNALAFNAAQVAAQLTAEASVKVAAAVCVGPDQSAQAHAWADCSAWVVAKVLATALAEAYIKGGCTYLSAHALTEVHAIIKADPYCACSATASACLDGSSCSTQSNSAAYTVPAAFAKQHSFAAAAYQASCSATATQVY